MSAVPDNFACTIVEVHGAAGGEWLSRLPSILTECERRWSLTILSPFAPLSYNYVAPAVRADGTDVVVKVGVPHRELLTEIEALRFYDGRGIIRLLDAAPDRGAMLLERLKPGTPLSSLPDDEQGTSIAAQVMRLLWWPAPPEHPFPSVAERVAGLGELRGHFGGTSGPFPATLVETAETLCAGLMGSTAEPALLHGDLNRENILAAERRPWLAIDSKGLVGEPAYEAAAFVLRSDPMPQLLAGPRPGRVLARRIDRLTEALGFDRARIVGWGLVQAVLAAWWTFEDHDGRGWEPWITCAELLDALRA